MAYNVLSRMTWQERKAYRAKRKVEIAAEKAAKTAKSMTCQCCGRQIFAQRGKIAHHGYERPGYGWQTASCMGATYLPFEVDRARLADLIVRLEHELQETRENLVNIRAEKVKLAFSIEIDCEPYWDNSSYRTVQRTRRNETRFYSRKAFDALKREGKGKIAEHHAACNAARENKTDYPKRDEALQIYFDSTTWDGLKDRAIRETQGRIDALRSDLKLSQDRFDSWKQTHTHFDPVGKFWVAVK
jgi:hypothetical protein